MEKIHIGFAKNTYIRLEPILSYIMSIHLDIKNKEIQRIFKFTFELPRKRIG